MPRMWYETIQKQIQKLQAQATKLEQEREQRKAKSVNRVLSLMRELGVSIEDLGQGWTQPSRRGRPPKDQTQVTIPEQATLKKTVPPRYRNQETGETWTGRGKLPRWLDSKIKSGNTKEMFLIPNE